jgi:hypothetical protein
MVSDPLSTPATMDEKFMKQTEIRYKRVFNSLPRPP